MKFRIRDLFAITTLVAGLFGAFQVDLPVFRQLIFLVLTTLGAIAGLLILRGKGNDHLRCSVFAGLSGGIFTLLAVLFQKQLYDSDMELAANSFPYDVRWLVEISFAPLAAAAIGAAIGPLIASFAKQSLPESYATKQKLSAGLLLATILLLFFSMIDRITMGSPSRNWDALVAPLVIAFTGFTIVWTFRIETNAINSEQMSAEHQDDPSLRESRDQAN